MRYRRHGRGWSADAVVLDEAHRLERAYEPVPTLSHPDRPDWIPEGLPLGVTDAQRADPVKQMADFIERNLSVELDPWQRAFLRYAAKDPNPNVTWRGGRL